MSKPKIGVLGSGNVGVALGTTLTGMGHPVMMGSSDPDRRARRWAQSQPRGALAGTYAEAARFGQLAILATRWHLTEVACREAREALADKLVLDATNPLVFHATQPPTLALANTDSGGEQVQRWLPRSKVVKALNAIGVAHMDHPEFPGGPPDIFICGNDAVAKREAAELCDSLGLGVVDAGAIDGARVLEPLAVFWIRMSMLEQSHGHAFKLLKQ